MSDFEYTLRANGLLPAAGKIVPDGKFYRCHTTDHPKKKNGFYKLSLDGKRGWYGNFALSGETMEWKAGADHIDLLPQRSPAEIQAKKDEARRITVAAVHAARDFYAAAKPLGGNHPYLEKKGLTIQGCSALRVSGKWLVVPMYRNGSLLNVQRIAPDGTKLYWEDAIAKGTTLRLARPGSTVEVFCEGFATGLAIFQCIPNCSVTVCFTASGLLLTAQEAKPVGMTVVCADNDVATAAKLLATTGKATNPGLEYGTKAANALGAGLAYPEGIKGSDWADALDEWKSPMRVRQEILRKAKPIFKK